MTTNSPASRRRIAALDAARALGVLAMVCGHTLDALLSPAIRSMPGVETYWRVRGLTAPLFLLVAGWAVTASVTRGRAEGWDILRGRLPRVGLLLLIGYMLRLPGWDIGGFIAGDRDQWRHFLAFDALHCIALGLLGGAAMLSALRGRAARIAGFVTLAALALAVAPLIPVTRARGIGLIALEQAALGTSPFPLFPWVAYFFVGGIVGLLATGARPLVAAAGMAAVGAGGVVAARVIGLDDLPVHSPVLFVLRAGQVLLILGALAAVPAAIAARAAPIGRASLFVYALHVPIVYGWANQQGLAQRIGPTLGLGAALASGVALAAVCLAVKVGVDRARRAVEEAGGVGAVVRLWTTVSWRTLGSRF
ncbi:MAG TPA: acyltransferase family protein [Anaeromyxobacteraceae bacterium]|nr:acyltransferase family protein [Anaeromyxobacteraceae bacterium]